VILNAFPERRSATRHGEGLAEGQLWPPRGGVGRKPMAKRWPGWTESH